MNKTTELFIDQIKQNYENPMCSMMKCRTIDLHELVEEIERLKLLVSKYYPLWYAHFGDDK